MLNLFAMFLCGGMMAGDAMPSSGGSANLVSLTMEDQFARPCSLESLRGDVVVLIFSDRGGAPASRELGARLHVQFHPQAAGQPPAIAAKAPPEPVPNWPANLPQPDAKMIAIAVIGEVPGAIRPMVRHRFRQASPDGVIWLDFTDAMRRQFRVVEDVPNIAVIDKQGRLRYTTTGPLDAPSYQRLVHLVETLRREPPTGPSLPAAAPPAIARPQTERLLR